jgi:outer membrane protein
VSAKFLVPSPAARLPKLGVTILCAFWLASFAQARDWVETVRSPFVDPLLTRPPQLDRGKVLPGEDSGVQCAGKPDGNSNAASSGSGNGNGSVDSNELPLEQPWTLAEVLDYAVCNNTQVRSAWAAIKVQAAQVGEARAAYLPTINLGVSQLRDRTSYPETQFVVNTDRQSDSQFATLTWRLLDFGGRDGNRRAANALLAAALASHDAIMQKTILGVVAGYFDVQTAQASRQSRAEALQWAQKILDSVQRREKQGAAAQSETLQAATALARAELETSRAQGVYEKSIAALLYAMGMPDPAFDDAPIALVVDTLEDPIGLGKDLAGWLQAARDAHPAIVSARSQLEAAREKLLVVRSEGLPSLDFTQSLYVNGRPNQGLSSSQSEQSIIGLTMNFPLFDGFARTYKQRGALAQIEIREAELDDAQNQVASDVHKAHADAMAALRNLAGSRKLEGVANQALEAAERRFERGVADVSELLSVQASLTDARQERVRSIADWQSARLRLVASAGVLGHASLTAAPRN